MRFSLLDLSYKEYCSCIFCPMDSTSALINNIPSLLISKDNFKVTVPAFPSGKLFISNSFNKSLFLQNLSSPA